MLNFETGYGRALVDALHAVQATTGKLFVVSDNSNANAAFLNFFLKNDKNGVVRRVSTIDAAINQCTAQHGDVILVAPDHSETISNATSINLDVEGITLIALGHGSNRAKIIMDTATTTTIPVSAANITVVNFVFEAAFADIVSVFTLTTANNFRLVGNKFQDQAADENFLYLVDTDATTSNADGLELLGNKWTSPDVNCECMVKMDGDNYEVKIVDNYVRLGVNNNTPALMAIATGKSVFDAEILDNRVYRLNTDTATGAILVSTDQSDNSGIISGNKVQHADTAAELLVTASSGFGVFQNFASGVAGDSGYLLPGADS